MGASRLFFIGATLVGECLSRAFDVWSWNVIPVRAGTGLVKSSWTSSLEVLSLGYVLGAPGEFHNSLMPGFLPINQVTPIQSQGWEPPCWWSGEAGSFLLSLSWLSGSRNLDIGGNSSQQGKETKLSASWKRKRDRGRERRKRRKQKNERRERKTKRREKNVIKYRR